MSESLRLDHSSDDPTSLNMCFVPLCGGVSETSTEEPQCDGGEGFSSFRRPLDGHRMVPSRVITRAMKVNSSDGASRRVSKVFAGRFVRLFVCGFSRETRNVPCRWLDFGGERIHLNPKKKQRNVIHELDTTNTRVCIWFQDVSLECTNWFSPNEAREYEICTVGYISSFESSFKCTLVNYSSTYTSSECADTFLQSSAK